MDATATKAARHLADVIVENLPSVDEVIFGLPAELKRDLFLAGVPKCYVRVGDQIREYLPVPMSLWLLVMHHVASLVREDETKRGAPHRSAEEDLESALIKVAEGGGLDTRKLAKDKPQEHTGAYRTKAGASHHVHVSWWSDNTLRIRAVR